MTADERSALVAELCRNLTLLGGCDAPYRARAATMVAGYRDVADALGCREEFEAALERLCAGQQARGVPIR